MELTDLIRRLESQIGGHLSLYKCALEVGDRDDAQWEWDAAQTCRDAVAAISIAQELLQQVMDDPHEADWSMGTTWTSKARAFLTPTEKADPE